MISVAPEVAVEQQRRLQELTNQILATTVDPHGRHTIQLAAGLNNWLLFSDWRRLPQGACFDDFDGTICFDVREGFGDSCMQFADERYIELGFEDIEAALHADYDSRQHELADTLAGIIQQSACFAYVRSFRPKEYGEQPLDEPTKRMRINAIGQSVRFAHKLEPSESIIPGSLPYIDFRRRVGRVDFETTYAQLPQISDTEALLRCRIVFRGLILQIIQEMYPQAKGAEVEFTAQGRAKITCEEEAYAPDPPPTVLLAEEACKKICEQFEDESSVRLGVGGAFLGQFIYGVLTNKDTTFEGAIEQAFRRTVKNYFQDSRPMVGIELEYRGDHCLRYLLHDTEGDTLTAQDRLKGSALGKWHSNYHTYELGFLSKRSMEELRAKRIGAVVTSNEVAYRGRLVYLQPHQKHVANEEFVLSIALNDSITEADPFIPGYILCYRDGNTFGFKQDEHDPYTICGVALPNERLGPLADKYAAIGLHDLATVIRNLGGGTVSDLRHAIRLHSIEYAPDESQELELKHIEEFENIIEDGKLLMQCDVVATFLKLSLEEVFGKGCASVTKGLVIDGDNIPLLQHMQTTFTHEDTVYILDGTFAEQPGSNKQRSLKSAPAIPFWVPPSVVKVNVVRPPTFKEEKIDLVAQTEQRLGILVQAADREDMYERVMRLKSDDPIRKTLELCIQVIGGEAGSSDIALLKGYIDNLREYKELARQLNLPDYNGPTLDALNHICRNLHRFLGGDYS